MRKKPTAEDVANSIKNYFPSPHKFYVMEGSFDNSALLIRRNGHTEAPVITVIRDEILVHGDGWKYVPPAVRKGLEALGYGLRYDKPAKIGGVSSFLYMKNSE